MDTPTHPAQAKQLYAALLMIRSTGYAATLLNELCRAAAACHPQGLALFTQAARRAAVLAKAPWPRQHRGLLHLASLCIDPSATLCRQPAGADTVLSATQEPTP